MVATGDHVVGTKVTWVTKPFVKLQMSKGVIFLMQNRQVFDVVRSTQPNRQNVMHFILVRNDHAVMLFVDFLGVWSISVAVSRLVHHRFR